MPYLIRNNTKEIISKKALAFSFFCIPIPIFLFFHIFGITILEFVFSNKFSTDYWYFIYCNFLGLIQYLQVLSYYILGALKDNSEVRKITLLNYLVISLLVPLYLILSFYFSLLGSIISFILVWIGRLCISLYYIFNKKDKVDFV